MSSHCLNCDGIFLPSYARSKPDKYGYHNNYCICPNPIFHQDKGIIPFDKNFHPEFDGYIAETYPQETDSLIGKGIIISYIHSKEKGKGNFTKLLNELKEKYAWIKVPTPSNTMFNICILKGFKLKKEYFEEPFNEWGEIMLWEKRELIDYG